MAMHFATDEEFLANWRSILSERVSKVVHAFSNIDGVRGLILGGSLGSGEPWALSDIDIIPIYNNAKNFEQARSNIANTRLAFIELWESEGWRTALDVGTLAFTEPEVLVGLQASALDILADDRWFHCLDKGYQSRAVYDPTGLATKLARWFTSHRFEPEIIEFRLKQHQIKTEYHIQELLQEIERRNISKANQALNNAIGSLKTFLLEKWGERDNSFARFGTRFERSAKRRGHEHLVTLLNDLSNLNGEQVLERMALAPDWIQKRHERSLQARKLIGEEVTKIQDARDVLRVFFRYELKEQADGTFQDWLAVDTNVKSLHRKSIILNQVLSAVFD
jgi:hypothetical protein